jgi:hypothetical protein
LKQRKASSVNATQEVADLILKLPKNGEIRNLCKNALIALSDNIFAGTQVKKSKIPKYYIEKYAVTNINVFRLDAKRRLVYTWVADANGVSVNILEIFVNHRQYEKRFGYS